MTIDIFDRLLNNEPVRFADPEYYKISDACATTRRLLLQMNNAAETQVARDILAQITNTAIDDTITVFTPFHINYGRNIKLGRNIFINFGCTFLDLGGILIDDNVMIAPGVKLLSEGHPTDPNARQVLTTGKIHIKKNVWIGANAVILAGVTVGENSVVAAGAIV